jgi:hypothetical protein
MMSPKSSEVIMDTQPEQRWPRRYNLLATFPDRSGADQAIEALKGRGLGEDALSLNTRGEVPSVEEAEMRDEVDDLWSGPGVVATQSETKGAVLGGVVGGVVGAIIGLVVGLIVFGPRASQVGGIVISIVVFVVGLATAGAVAGGFVKPRVRPEQGDDPEDRGATPDQGMRVWGTANEIVVGVHVDDRSKLAVAEEVLEAARPIRLDLVGSEGEVLDTEETGLGTLPVQPGSGRREPVVDEE